MDEVTADEIGSTCYDDCGHNDLLPFSVEYYFLSVVFYREFFPIRSRCSTCNHHLCFRIVNQTITILPFRNISIVEYRSSVISESFSSLVLYGSQNTSCSIVRVNP